MKKTYSRKDPFQDCPSDISIQPGMLVKFIKGIYLEKSDPLEFINGSVVMKRSDKGPYVDGEIHRVLSCTVKDTDAFLILQECLEGNTIAVNRNLIGFYQRETHSIRTISPIEKKRKSKSDDLSSDDLSSVSWSTRGHDISASQKSDTEEVEFVLEEDLSLSHDSKGLIFFVRQITTSSTTVGEEWRRAVDGFKMDTDKKKMVRNY